MRGLSVAIAFLLFSLGCSSPYEQALPVEGSDPQKFQKALAKLSEEERKYVAAFLIRRELGQAFGNVMEGETPTTIRGAIENQRTWLEEVRKKEEQEALERAQAEARAEQLRQEEEARRLELRKAVTVTVSGLTFLPSDFRRARYRDSIQLRLLLRNETDRAIDGVKGIVHFDDLFGDRIHSVGLSYDDGLPARETKQWTGAIEHNSFIDSHSKLANTPLERMKVSWEPDRIVYSAEPSASD